MKLNKQFRKGSNQRGFTLIELMVVVVILAVLATFVVPKLMDRPDEARIVKAKQDIGAISSALQLYKLDNYNFPTTDQGLEALVTKPDSDPEPKHWKKLLDQLPKDPWGNPYLYLQPGEHGEFDLFTYGADGMDGGEGINATIGNWEEK
ncbi:MULTISPECIES: type II secretion system major pseudopilin GspG [Thiomicrorhabdus]|uniref:Type II secretion system core protein G n=1 Tax=Thiomicrorhabdus heinhorstiae TaxID=2748010 RepID=A0ABS0BVX7_9GAMM|nr:MULTISPECIES: type II secretion system major pseudopilin GspG [Thiomicrorhabdus]MBF6057975.1 type II secretion system major pseudopilin GspG [Thiomicrorhabdus heinhorstiae]